MSAAKLNWRMVLSLLLVLALLAGCGGSGPWVNCTYISRNATDPSEAYTVT